MGKYKIDIKITGSNKTESGSFYTPIRIGRKSDNDIVFQKSKDISRYHLRIEKENEILIVRNFSKNGYILNNTKQMEARPIRAGDKIGFNNFGKQLEILAISELKHLEKEENSTYRPSRIYKMVNAVQIRYQNKLQKQRYLLILVLFIVFLALSIITVVVKIQNENLSNEISINKTETSYKFNRLEKEVKNKESENQNKPNKDTIDYDTPESAQKETENKEHPPQKVLTNKELQNKFNQMFKNEVVEIIYNLGNSQLTKNGFVYNGYIYSPSIRDGLFDKIGQANVKFIISERTFKLFLQKKEIPFFRYKIMNNNITLNYRNVMEDCSTVDINAHIFFIEYLQKANRLVFQCYQGSTILAMKNKMLSKLEGKLPRLGALAVTQKGAVIGLVTAFENDNEVLIETMNQINQKLSTVMM